ncbi:MAG: RHS repeat-associated core domain-containing protein, partial [Acidobacteria bacterium]|nr:RHS repeat-associated core domain-containing protein [Acidobacteriota bacterium]
GSSGNSAQFTGRENDGTGLYYYRARYYHPTLQRFISEDPLASQSYLLSEVPGSSLLGAQTILAPSEPADTGSHEAPILALAPFVVGQNTYAYVMNRPTILTDPSGESPALVRALQIAAAAAARYAKQAAKFCRNVRCKIELHDAHHPFGFPFYEKRRHVQLTCWIKGQKGSTLILRIPY